MTAPAADLGRVLARRSFIELPARERARAVLDEDGFRELLDPFDRTYSPWLAMQGIVPQADDGVVIARGRLDGQPAVVAAIEGGFQGGSLGEIGGAKIACALELAARDHERGILTRPVLLLETGGVRLQEANLGLAAIAEIHARIVALRGRVPVVGVVAGMVGCFGGMSLAAALCSHLVVTRQGRLGMNGPEVIEQEAGVEELDASDRRLVWSLVGGEQRRATGLADALVEDDARAVAGAVRDAFRRGSPARHRSEQVAHFREQLGALELPPPPPPPVGAGPSASRGQTWFEALSGRDGRVSGGPASVRVADVGLGGEAVRVLAVVPDPQGRFPRARSGEVGLEEAWALAAYVREAVEADAGGPRRPLVAVVDVPGQAYGRLEERLGIHLACAAAVDAYATARLAGHPVVALLVGRAMSGAFLAHGYQADRLLALDDPGVLVHAMSKAAAARVTRRSVAEVEALGARVLPMSYDVRAYARLGFLHQIVAGVSAGAPSSADVERVRDAIASAVADVRSRGGDVGHRLSSAAAAETRAATIDVRRRLAERWAAG